MLGDVRALYAVQRSSLSAQKLYWYKGRRHELPGDFQVEGINHVEFSGRTGRAANPIEFSVTATAQGVSCMSSDIGLDEFSKFWGPKATLREKESALAALTIATAGFFAPALRSAKAESIIRGTLKAEADAERAKADAAKKEEAAKVVVAKEAAAKEAAAKSASAKEAAAKDAADKRTPSKGAGAAKGAATKEAAAKEAAAKEAAAKSAPPPTPAAKDLPAKETAAAAAKKPEASEPPRPAPALVLQPETEKRTAPESGTGGPLPPTATRGEPDAPAPTRKSSPPPRTTEPSGVEKWENYKREEAKREAREEETSREVTNTIRAFGDQIAQAQRDASEREERAEERAREEAREARQAKKEHWARACPGRAPTRVTDPTFYAASETKMQEGSLWCQSGALVSPTNHAPTDTFRITATKRQKLRAFIGEGFTLRAEAVDGGKTFERGPRITLDVEPGDYLVHVEAKETGFVPAAPHYLRIVDDKHCWTDEAVVTPLGRGTIPVGSSTCLGRNGKPARLLRVRKHTDENLRTLRFTLQGGNDPAELEIFGENGRFLGGKTDAKGGVLTASVADLSGEDVFVLVGSQGEPDAKRTLDIEVVSSTYPAFFRDDSSLGIGALRGRSLVAPGDVANPEKNDAGVALFLDYTYTFGAQLGRYYGLGGSVSGAIGYASGDRVMSQGFLGPAIHLGTPRASLRLVPGVGFIGLDDDVGFAPGARADITVPFQDLSSGVRFFGGAHQRGGDTLLSFGMAISFLPAPPPPDGTLR